MNTGDRCVVAYTEKEKLLLASLVDRHKNVIENKRTDATTVAKKQQGWEVISNEYNCQASLVSMPRSALQLKKLWSNLKQRKRKAATESKFKKLLTGGGPEEPEIGDPVMEAVDVAAPYADVTLSCPWDSTAAFEDDAAKECTGTTATSLCYKDHSYTRNETSPSCSGSGNMSKIYDNSTTTPNTKYTVPSTPSSTKGKRKVIDTVHSEAVLRVKKMEDAVQQQNELHEIKMETELQQKHLNKIKIERKSEQLKAAIALRKKAEVELEIAALQLKLLKEKNNSL